MPSSLAGRHDLFESTILAFTLRKTMKSPVSTVDNRAEAVDGCLRNMNVRRYSQDKLLSFDGQADRKKG